MVDFVSLHLIISTRKIQSYYFNLCFKIQFMKKLMTLWNSANIIFRLFSTQPLNRDPALSNILFNYAITIYIQFHSRTEKKYDFSQSTIFAPSCSRNLFKNPSTRALFILLGKVTNPTSGGSNLPSLTGVEGWYGQANRKSNVK